MSIPLYLAMSDEEIRTLCPSPAHIARLGLGFSPDGLAGLPEGEGPEGMLYVLEDRVPWDGAHLEEICGQIASLLRERKAFGLLLDFEREATEKTQLLASALFQCCRELGCRCGAPEGYGAGDAVFLPPPSCAEVPRGRDGTCWYEASPGAVDISIGPEGAACRDAFPCPQEGDLYSPALMAHYRTERDGDGVQVHVYDSADSLLRRLEAMGAELAVGLYAQWGQA